MRCYADILNALHGKPGASRALYGAIFGREAVRQQVDQGQQGRIRLPQANRQHWDVPKRISAAHQPLVRALGQIIGAPSRIVCTSRP